MKLHPLCKLFPQMVGQDWAEFVADIRANGLTRPITTFEGMILDGQNRYLACLEAKVEPRFEPFEGKDPLQFVISNNHSRRHLETGQRAMIAAEIAKWRIGQNQHNEGVQTPHTLQQAAEEMKVSRSSVSAAKAIKAHSPRLARQVKAGTLSLNAAMEKINPRQVQPLPAPPIPSAELSGSARQPFPARAELSPPYAIGTPMPEPLADPLPPFKAHALEKWTKWFTAGHNPYSSRPAPRAADYDQFVKGLLK